jgi:endonuclease/exonuclease/phosphatase (EEP) superfamily protein YafD
VTRSSRRLADRGAAFKVLYFIAVVLGWALLAVAVAAVWLHFFPGRGRVAIAAASAVPLMLLAVVPAIIILAVTRRWISTVLAVILLGVGIWTQAPLFVAADAPAGASVTVVQANLKLGEADVAEVVARVRDTGAALLTVEEMTPQALTALENTDLRGMMPYEFVVPGDGGNGTGIFSRYPLRNTAPLNGFTMSNLRADVDLPGAPGTTVFAVHPIPPYPYDPDRWVDEMKRLKATVHSVSGDRVIVSGDFNATWDHAQYRSLLDKGFRDATEQAGEGVQLTYPADRGYPPLIGIDHVVTRGFTATSLRTFTVSGSDHRAVVVSLVPN